MIRLKKTLDSAIFNTKYQREQYTCGGRNTAFSYILNHMVKKLDIVTNKFDLNWCYDAALR